MNSRRRTAPRGHGLYLAVLDAVPPDAASSLRDLATLIRHIRRVIRLAGQRAVRRSLRRIRRCARWGERHMRHREIRRLRSSRLDVSATPGTTPGIGALEPVRRDWLDRLVRLIVPPTVTLPGEGPMLAVDARGLSSDELAPHVERFGARTIYIVDDPDIAWLRAGRLYYEYAPATPAVSPDERLRWITAAYGVDHVVRLGSTAGATTTGLHDHSEENC